MTGDLWRTIEQQKAIHRKSSAVNDLRQTLRGADAPALQRSVALLLWHSATLAPCCSNALLLQRSVAPTLWCSSAPALHCSSTLALRCSGALLFKRSTAPALWQSFGLALRCYGTPALCCSGGLLKHSAAPALWRSTAPAPTAAALCCSRASPGQMIRGEQSAVINLPYACRCSPANERGKQSRQGIMARDHGTGTLEQE